MAQSHPLAFYLDRNTTLPLPRGPVAAEMCAGVFPFAFLETAQAFHTSALASIDVGTD